MALALTVSLPLRQAHADYIQKPAQDASTSVVPLDLSRVHTGYQPDTSTSDTEIHPFAGSHRMAPAGAESPEAAALPAVVAPSTNDEPSHYSSTQVRPMVLQPATGSVPEPSFLALAGVVGAGMLVLRRRARAN